MSRIRRRGIKAETRLETLEGRITPTAMSLPHVMGAQILVLTPDSHPTHTGISRADAISLKHYQHIRNPLKAERFLGHHPKLEAWLEQSLLDRNAPQTTTPGQGSNPAVTTTSSGHPGPTSTGTADGSTTSPPSGSGSNNPVHSQGPAGGSGVSMGTDTGDSSSPGTPGGSSSDPGPGNLDATLSRLYQTYEAQGIDQAKAQFSGLVAFSEDSIGVEIHGNGGDFQEMANEIARLDPQISVTGGDSTFQTVDAFVPVADLPSLARDADQLVQSVTALSPPVRRL
jgi:hypothetical protein